MASFCGADNVLELDGGMVAQPCGSTKNHCILHFERLNLMVNEF